jgi:hypothetical protein
MQWAAGKLLGQDWVSDNQELHGQAQAKLEALAGRLARDKRHAEADQLRATLQKLRERDLVVKISWEAGDSGPADLELEVKEPNGSLCSSQLRQTPGGGTLLGNDLASLTRASYVAAQAFSGDYQVAVKRLWGTPLGGKFRLEIIRHQGTPQEERQVETVRIDQKHTFKVQLKDGRRTTLAVVPSVESQSQQKAERVQLTNPYKLLRDIADSEYGGQSSPMSGGFGTSAAARPATAAQAQANQSDRLAYQMAMTTMTGVGLTARATVSEDQQSLRVSVIPNFQGLSSSSGRPVVDLPLIPGASR